MRRTTFKSKIDLDILVSLHANHTRFHTYLDKLSAKTNDPAEIEMLIELRSFNVECMSKYADLISMGDIELNPVTAQRRSKFQLNVTETNMILWNIHAQLARFIPVYAAAIRDKRLNKVSRMIISNNYDKIINLKDDLLHPIPQLEAVSS